MAQLSALDTASTLGPVIGKVGSLFMIHPDTAAFGKERGFANGFAFYMAGRGGVLGDVDGDVVYSAFAFWNPELVSKMWEAGIATGGARAAAHLYAEACAQWGRKRLTGMDGLDRLAELLKKHVDVVDSAGLALFAGWRAMPLPEDAPARAYHLIHVARELRGSVHVLAVAATGLTPLQAVLTEGNGDLAIAKMHGWSEVSTEGIEALQPLRARAETLTNEMMARIFSDGLSGDERAELSELVTRADAHIAAAQ